MSSRPVTAELVDELQRALAPAFESFVGDALTPATIARLRAEVTALRLPLLERLEFMVFGEAGNDERAITLRFIVEPDGTIHE